MHVVAFRDGLRPGYFVQHAHFYLLPELPAAILRYAEIFLLAPLLMLWLILRGDVQIIMAQSPFEGAIGALAKQVAGLLGKSVKLVIESHGDFEEALFLQRQIHLGSLYRALMTGSARYGFRHADALRAVSSTARAQLERWAPGKPLEQFMTWTDFDVFRHTVRAVQPSQTQDIVYVGALIRRKGVHLLIDAFVRLQVDFPNAGLYLIGKPEDRDYTAELEKQVASLKLDAKVHFVGALQQSRLAERIASARVLVLPSTTEGLARVLIEGMLCGTPVIATQVGGVLDIVQEGVNGYIIPPNDVDALTERLRSVLSNPEIDGVGERARDIARQFFSEEAYVEGYRRLIEVANQS